MAGCKFSQCLNYPGPPLQKPFNVDRDMPFVVASFGFTVLSFVTVGFVVGFIFGPLAAAIGVGVGLVIGIAAGVADTIVDRANQWLNQRLVCLGHPAFAAKAHGYVEQECRGIREAHALATRQEQQKLVHRWSIHPVVAGCQPADPDPGPPCWASLTQGRLPNGRTYPWESATCSG